MSILNHRLHKVLKLHTAMVTFKDLIQIEALVIKRKGLCRPLHFNSHSDKLYCFDIVKRNDNRRSDCVTL